MTVFLDTSSLFKLYFKEKDSSQIENLFTLYNVTAIFLSELTKIEFSSTLWRKARMEAFREDSDKYFFVWSDTALIEEAGRLLMKYGRQGLRTLDSIQLATAARLRGKADLYSTSDALLNSFSYKKPFESNSINHKKITLLQLLIFIGTKINYQPMWISRA